MDFLAYLVEKEVAGREETQGQRRLKRQFISRQNLQYLDFSFQTSVSQVTIWDLASLEFVKAPENFDSVGPSRCGQVPFGNSPRPWKQFKPDNTLFITTDELANKMCSCLADDSLPKYIRSLLRNDSIILDEVGYLT